MSLRLEIDGEGSGTTDASLAERIRRLIGEGCVDEIRVDQKDEMAQLDQIVASARLAGRSVRVAAALAGDRLPPALAGERWVPPSAAETSWQLQLQRPPAWSLAAKRLMDLTLALLLGLMLSPLLLVLAAVVRLSSPGPSLYRWRVLGRYGRPFTGYKFRTMVADADQRLSELLAHNEMTGPVFKLTDDPRLTRVGRWLRRYSLDELPQLWSVVRGQMSLVGPRPPFRHEYQQFELWQMRKLSVKPGLTCLWQVRGRNAITHFNDWAHLDLEYIDAWSLGLDVKILAQTLLAVVRATGR